MTPFRRMVVLTAILFACMGLAGAVSAAGIQTYLGDTVPLHGYSPSSTQVYLFLTGPNLPANGVALNDITRLAENGGFTVVSVDGSDDSWSYNWHTGSVNGRLDEGTYTVWVVNSPSDRAHLQNAEYGTIAVTLSGPTLTAGTSLTAGVAGGVTQAPTQQPPGSLTVTSDPDNASVVVNDQYRGKTPLTLDALAPGSYTVNVSRFGFYPYTTSADVVSYGITTVAATLPPRLGTIAVNTSPPGANVSVDGQVAGTTPVTLQGLEPGNHTISLTKDGFAPSVIPVSIVAGANPPVAVALAPSSPFGALPTRAPGLTMGTVVALCCAAGLGFVRVHRR